MRLYKYKLIREKYTSSFIYLSFRFGLPFCFSLCVRAAAPTDQKLLLPCAHKILGPITFLPDNYSLIFFVLLSNKSWYNSICSCESFLFLTSYFEEK